jgi:hypothetical protein
MKYKEILKLLFFSIATAAVSWYINILVIWKNMKITKENFHKNLISLDTYQQKAVETVYLEGATLFVLPFVAAIAFYFFAKINLRPKYNFLMFMVLFTILFFLSYILIGYSYQFLK